MLGEAKPASINATAQLSEQEIAERVRAIHEAACARPLTVEEKIFLLDSAKIPEVRIKNEPSVRRVDWYPDRVPTYPA